MRKTLFTFCLITSLAAACFAQSSDAQRSPIHDQSSPGYEGYAGRAEVFVNAFGLFGNHPDGNGIGEQATQAGGGSAGYRFHLTPSSSLEGRYGFSRNSQKYTSGATVSSVSAYFSEISGSYVYNLATSRRIQPFLAGGGGIVIFSPGNYGSTSGIYGSSASSGPVTGFPRQSEGMFAYGGGADLPAFSHFYVRLEFRDVAYKTPDFGNTSFHTNTFSFSHEPTVGFAYRF